MAKFSWNKCKSIGLWIFLTLWFYENVRPEKVTFSFVLHCSKNRTTAIGSDGLYLTIILRNRAEYRLILSELAKIRRYSARLSRMIFYYSTNCQRNPHYTDNLGQFKWKIKTTPSPISMLKIMTPSGFLRRFIIDSGGGMVLFLTLFCPRLRGIARNLLSLPFNLQNLNNSHFTQIRLNELFYSGRCKTM